MDAGWYLQKDNWESWIELEEYDGIVNDGIEIMHDRGFLYRHYNLDGAGHTFSKQLRDYDRYKCDVVQTNQFKYAIFYIEGYGENTVICDFNDIEDFSSTEKNFVETMMEVKYGV